jgi:hypothetical protein
VRHREEVLIDLVSRETSGLIDESVILIGG